MGSAREGEVEQVRRFRRFCARRLDLLREALKGSGYSTAEARVLLGFSRRGETTASVLEGDLDLDGGYLSRTLRGLERASLLRRRPGEDRRKRLLSLAPGGEAAVADLDDRLRRLAAATLDGLGRGDRADLLAAMETVRGILGDGEDPDPGPVVLRGLRSGDVGWIVHRHGVLYRREFGWDARFEALVAEILGRFAADHDPARERAWVAEADGRFAGCVFLVRQSRSTARLRCLLVEPSARGRGLGRRLVDACLRFARAAGYRRIVLWTNAELRAARRIYEAAGFRLGARERTRKFGRTMEFQTWERALAPRRRDSRR